jgi:hypothetical protein
VGDMCDEDKVGEIWGGLGTWTSGEIKGRLVGEVRVGTSGSYLLLAHWV